MKCRGTILKSAYEDLLGFLKLKRKNKGEAVSNNFAPQYQEHNNHLIFYHMSLLQLVPYEDLPDSLAAATSLSTQPSAPPIPDSTVEDYSDSIGTTANILANFEVPWLEEACHIHPSLIGCQRKRTPKYAGWAFIALGRVLHFLENTKVVEMNEVACECLQLLWDEVQVFGFELSWLAPQVEFALDMKGYMEKVRKVNKLKEEKRSIEVRIQELSMKLVEIEKEIESSKGDLAKSWWNCNKLDLERLLGYQRHSPVCTAVVVWKSVTLYLIMEV